MLTESRQVTRTVALVFLACLCITTGIAGQDRDTMWSSVSGDAANVTLAWSKDHPWDTVLSRGGVQLVARYRTDGRDADAMEFVSVSQPGERNQRRFVFALPAAVRQRPIGPVCLFFQLPDRRVLPLRRPDGQGGDTAGFRYVEWEAQVRRRGDLLAAQNRVVQAEQALAVSTQSVSRQQDVVSRRGWSDLAGCENVAAPADRGPLARPYDAVPPQGQDDVARRVCVFRVWNGRGVAEQYLAARGPRLVDLQRAGDRPGGLDVLDPLYSMAFFLPEAGGVLGEVVAARGGYRGTFARREAQAAEFFRDWERLSPAMASYEPHLSDNDYLSLPSTAAAAALRVFGPALARRIGADWLVESIPPATLVDKEGTVGVALDAYSGCLEDSRKQLALKWTNWEALQASAPEREAAARAFFVRECRQGVSQLDKLRAEQTMLQEQLVREQAALQAVSPAVPAPGPSPSRPLTLNTSSCTQP